MASEVLLLGFWWEAAALALMAPVWAWWALSAACLLLLAAAAALPGRRALPQPGRLRRFCILIPAHDEELNLGAVLAGLRRLDYPADRFAVVVIADNCTDGTARAARAGGAEVLERVDADRRGKGYALEWAVRQLLADARRFDAFVVMDADSLLNPAFLRQMNARLDGGAHAIQARYDVLNAWESWRTRLMTVALALAHHVKPLGRARLGLSDGLKGNGMCFSREAAERVPWSGESITEDMEHTLRLVRAGYRVEYAPEARVEAQMPTTGRQAASQRCRWEGGRWGLARRAVPLLAEGLRRRNLVLADRAADLLMPPFAEMLAVPAVMVLAAAGWRLALPESGAAQLALGAWAGVLAACVAYLAAGLAIARVPAGLACALLLAPAYMLWKFALYGRMVARRGAQGWRRTERRTLEG